MNGFAATMDREDVDLVVESSLLGTLSVPSSQTYDFSNGLLGFPNALGFALIPTDRSGLFWLQSTEFEALTFLLVDPFQFVDDYGVDLGPKELGDLASGDAAQILLLCVLSLPRTQDDQPTVNLQGPLALHVSRGEGRQVVLQDSNYGTRHLVDLDRRPAS